MSKLLINFMKKRYTGNQAREAYGILSGAVGIFCNIMLCVAKFIVGSFSNSVAITADAVNNLSDAASNVVTIAGTKLSNKASDKEHPFGHGRIEYISALVIAFLIFLMGFELGKSSVLKIITPEDVKFSPIYIIVLTAAIIVKLWIGFFNNKLYKLTNNVNLKAVKQDSINDCISTFATIVAIVIGAVFGFARADGIIGVCVAVFVVLSGVDILKDVSGKILGQAPSKELVAQIESEILSNDLIIGVHDLIVHDYGNGKIIASAHAEVPSDSDINVIHEAIDSVEHKIASNMKIDICIHMDPITINNEEVNRYKAIVADAINQYNADFSFHDFRMVSGKNHKNLIFDLVVPFDCKADKEEIKSNIASIVYKTAPEAQLVINVEHPYI